MVFLWVKKVRETMISANNISLAYGKRVIFKDVNIKFVPGNTETEFEHNKIPAGQFVSKDAILKKVGAFAPVASEVAAQSLWDAVMKRRLVTYVTAQDRLLCTLMHVSPVASVKLSKMAIRRYVPLDGAPAKTTIGQDLAKAGAGIAAAGMLFGVVAGWFIRRRRT